METSVNVEKRQVDCCLHGCVAFTHNRSHMTWFDTSGMATRRQARQMTNSPLTAWLLYMLSDPSFCPHMMFVMKEALCAACKNSDGKQRESLNDWHGGLTVLEALRADRLAADTDISLSASADGFAAVEHCSEIPCHSMLWRDVTLQFVPYFDIVFDVIACT